MEMTLAGWIRVAGAGQFCVLLASALVPLKLNWKRDLASLPRLHRQLYWTYGGYVVLGYVTLAVLSLACAEELAGGSPLARGVCAYGMLFWGIRLSLQAVLDVKPHMTAWWLTAGYHTLTVLFVFFTAVYGYAVFH